MSHSHWTTSTLILKDAQGVGLILVLNLSSYFLFSARRKTSGKSPRKRGGGGAGGQFFLLQSQEKNSVEMPNKAILTVCPFHMRSLLSFELPLSLLTHPGAKGNLRCLGKCQHSVILSSIQLWLLGNDF